ncbi:MAG: NYN domain-containing protein [Candidatus Zixiibacteriota bacterium]|nr:MAG: NYN domain-containing protein [candidate division Zixibacteria bacterium]
MCRIGVFYDGSFFSCAQRYFAYAREMGWLQFQPFHDLIQSTMRDKEQGFASYKVVYAGWYQGLFKSTKASFEQLKLDRNRHHDLMHAGIEAKFLPMSETEGEKGIDVAMAVDVLQVANDGDIDIAALVTGDGDFIPLVRAIMKYGIRVMAVYFEFDEGDHKSYINERLLRACNYAINVNALEKDHKFKDHYKRLFYKSEKGTGK